MVLAVLAVLWALEMCVLWLHMLAVATDSCWMDEGCVSGCWLLLRASPATSAIRTPNRKSQVSTPYSAWRRKLPDQRCRLVWLLLLPSLLTVSPPCFAAVLVEASPPSCVLPLRMYSSPLFPLCVSEYHDYFMLLSLFLVISLW